MITPLRCSDMACIFKGSHCSSCTPRVHPLSLCDPDLWPVTLKTNLFNAHPQDEYLWMNICVKFH